MSYTDFVGFVLRCLPKYGLRYHAWTEREAATLEAIITDVRARSSEYSSIAELTSYMENTYGLIVPFAWGTYSEPYFRNWYQLNQAKEVKND